MSTLNIVKGYEFRLVMKETIDSDEMFLGEYKQATAMLNEIIDASNMEEKKNGSYSDWKNSEYENNIIAFCGERGEGKSSAMMTFVNAVYNHSKEGILFSNYPLIKETFFAEPMIIDPSLFDDVHNVLDVVLAKLFRNFSQRYEKDNQRVDIKKREELLDKFQKVYRYLSLINNQTKMLDNEYDYEGNIGKLSKLGESTNLKVELRKLIAGYLEFMKLFADGKGQYSNNHLLIAIDDLDLCSANAYKMAEQIRKYLILPNVTIILAVRIEQLELCVQEKNIFDFRYLSNRNVNKSVKMNQLDEEIEGMAERYVTKLIPKARRIYLPKVQSFEDIRIIYSVEQNGKVIWDSQKRTSLVLAMLDLIYEKTGMRFLPRGKKSSLLLPNNLRDMVSWIVRLADMQAITERRDFSKNIELFRKYFEIEWRSKLSNGMEIKQMGKMNAFHLHVNTKVLLTREKRDVEKESFVQSAQQPVQFVSDRQDSFYEVMELFRWLKENIYSIEKETFIYGIQVLYTIRLNQLLQNKSLEEFSTFIGGYIWGGYFNNVLPAVNYTAVSRSRFTIKTWKVFNDILEIVCKDGKKFFPYEDDKALRVSKISKDENRRGYIYTWIMLGILSNLYFYNPNQPFYFISKGTIIYDNYNLLSYVQISLENYLVSLCNLREIYDKVNMRMLGIEENEFLKIVAEMERNNERSIECIREIVANIDLALEISKYCTENRDYKKNTIDEIDRSSKLVDKFFENIISCMNKYGTKTVMEDFKYFYLGEKGSHSEIKIDISYLYAKLIEACVQEQQEASLDPSTIKKRVMLQEFREKLTGYPERWNEEALHVSSYLKSATVGNAKLNLENLALNVQRYIGISNRFPVMLNVDAVCEFYSHIIDLDEKEETVLSDEMKKEYSRLVKVQKEIDI